MKKLYLKKNVAIEPLFCSWYFWGYLVPPHIAGFFLKNRFLKIMKSFLESPEIHRMASQNPKLAGGQFLDISKDNMFHIQMLVQKLEREAQPLLTLAEDIETLDLRLQSFEGESLETIYTSIPANLKGCVELVYDHNNHPRIHFFEKIIYEKYYNRGLQSVLLTPLQSDQRKFVLSTPRLTQEHEISLPLNFSDETLSLICQARHHAICPTELLDKFSLNDSEIKTFMNLFTEQPPLLGRYNPIEQKEVRVRYFGHACVLIQTRNTTVLIDPLISYFNPPGAIDRYTLDDLPQHIDFVLFTHNHLDHIAFETLLFLKNRVKNFVFPRSSGGSLLNPDIKLMFEYLGFKNLHAVDHLENISFSDGQLFSIPFLGEHGDLDIQSKCAFFLEINNRKILFAADSNNLDEGIYEYLYNKVGPVDTLFIGMECVGGPLDWIYGPLLSKKIKHSHKQSRRYSGSDEKKAIKIVNTLRAKEVYVYAMGQESWLSHITSLNYNTNSKQIVESDKFISSCQQNNIKAKRLYGKDEWSYLA